MKKNILLVLVAAIILSAFVFSLFGCGALSVASTTVASTALGGMDVWVFVPDAGARNIIVKSALKNTPKVLPPSGYVALQGATLSVVGYNGKTAITGEDGNAYLGGLADGSYNVTIAATGYAISAYTVSVTTGVVTNIGGSSGITTQTSSAPSIWNLSSNKGPAGIPVVLTGDNFGSTQSTSTVTVAGFSGTVSIVSWDNARIVFTLPANVPVGAVGLTVTVGSTTSNSMPFTVISAGTTGYPNIIGINPIAAPAGTSVTITGSNFGSSQGSSVVSFNGTTATSITSWSDTQIICSAPSGAVDGGVVVIVNGVSSNAISFAAGLWLTMNSNAGNNQLRAVWGTASNNVYAVGANGTIVNYNGSSWNIVTIPGMGPTQQLNSIWGTSASNIYLAGNDGKFWNWNGSSWLLITLPEGGTHINCVWGCSPTNVFAVGAGGKIWHYNSTTGWTLQRSGGNDLIAVWGTPSDNVFAVGKSGTIRYYDGQEWSNMTSMSGTTNQLNSVWGSDVSDVFVAGKSGTILHYNGTIWSKTSVGEQDLNGVWGTASNNVYIVGNKGVEFGTIVYYNGNVWTLQSSPTAQNLKGIWGTSASDIFAVGDSGTILHYTQ